jgi:hypothetical protein
MAKAKDPSSGNPMEREAKENIDAVKDIVGADDELTKLQQALAAERKSLEATLQLPRDAGTAGDIEDAEQRIRELEHQINAHDKTTESLDLFSDSAGAVTARESQAEYEATNRRHAEEQKKRQEATEAAERDRLENMGPAERAEVETAKAIGVAESDPSMEQDIDEARKKDEATRKMVDQAGKQGCTTPPKVLLGIGVGIAVVIAIVLILFSGDDDKPSTTASGAAAGATTGRFAPPAPEKLGPGDQLFEGSSGGPLGCIACDGQSRFIHIENNTTAKGNDMRAGQEIVWPADGTVVEFGANANGPNKGRYGFNLFVNGAQYGPGCAMEIGETSCKQNRPGPLAKGDRVTIIVGEAGTVDKGVPVEHGEFTLSWWFVFQPS